MTTAERTAPELLLTRRAARIGDELDRLGADGWLVYDFRGSNPAFSRLVGSPEHSPRGAFLYPPRHAPPRLLIHHVDAGNLARLGLEVVPYGGRDQMLANLRDLLGPARRV